MFETILKLKVENQSFQNDSKDQTNPVVLDVVVDVRRSTRLLVQPIMRLASRGIILTKIVFFENH